MPVVDIFSECVQYKYKSNLRSRGTLVVLLVTLSILLIPIIVIHFTGGFSVRNYSYTEKPNIIFKRKYLLIAESNDDVGPIICSAFRSYKGNSITDSCTITKVKEFDYNNDGLNDALKFELCFFAKIPINSVRLLLFFNYELRERNKLAMETMAALQYTIPTNVQRISIVGDLRLDQKILLHNQGIHDIYNYSTDINDFTLFELLTENARRKFAIQIANDKLTWERGFSVEKETVVQTEIFYSEEMIHYRPGLWEELKWAWIQYFAIFFLFASVGKYIIKIIFVKGYVRSYVIPPWKEKGM